MRRDDMMRRKDDMGCGDEQYRNDDEDNVKT